MELSEIRKNIDEIDNKLIELLQQRFEKVLETLNKKESIEDLGREKFILKNIMMKCPDSERYAFFENVYRLIFKEGKRIQAEANRIFEKPAE